METKIRQCVRAGVTLLWAAGSCSAQATFEALTGMRYAISVTPDGNVVAGRAAIGQGDGPAKWVRGSGMQPLPGLPGQTLGQAWAVSQDGTRFAGTVVTQPGGQTAARWMGSPPVESLSGMNAYGMSATGHLIVGEGSGGARVWDQAGNVTILPLPAGASSGGAHDISASGDVIVGRAYTPGVGDLATRWVNGSLTTLGTMGTFNGLTSTLSYACSPDGAVVVGYGTTSQGFEAFRWTESTGMVPLGDIPGGSHFSIAYATAADGSLIGGSYNGLNTAFIWRPQQGMQDLKQVLESEYDLNLSGWTLSKVSDITPDGRVWIGEGTGPNGALCWMVTIPAPGASIVFGMALLTRRRRPR